jgi:hypothetical protein
MVKRYDGNSGRVVRVEDAPEAAPRPAPPPGSLPPPPPRRSQGPGGLPLQLRRLLTRSLGDLETEDLLLMLILYLLYRESGDRDWLMTLGAMLFV